MDILEHIAIAVCEMEEELTVSLAQQAIDQGVDPLEVLNSGLIRGMEKAGELFEKDEYFVPEILLCSDALYAGLAIIDPLIKSSRGQAKGKIVLGTVQGDFHDIGVNIVKLMLETANYQVFYLGQDVAVSTFIEKALEEDVDIIGMSTLMTTTMEQMSIMVNTLKERGLRDRFKVIVGGGPISQSLADRVGADGYADNAMTAVRLVDNLLK